jgi:hypothetical protein
MRTRYERHRQLDDVLDRAGKLSMRTIIFDVEPLVSWWDNTQESLDWGVAMVVGKVSTLPTVRALVFSTNSVRRPTVIPEAGRDLEVSYLASAAKPLRTAPYRDLPRPGAVVGDQVPTDGLLARRLGYTFLHYEPPLDGIPLGPRVMHRLGRLGLPLLFKGQEEDSLSLPVLAAVRLARRPRGHGAGRGPLGARFPAERRDRRFDRRVEMARVDRPGQPVTLDLAPHRVFELGEHQAGTARVQRLVEFFEYVGGGRVDVSQRLGGDQDPGGRRIGLSEPPDLVAERGGVGEEERCVEPVDHQAGQQLSLGIDRYVVVALQAGYPSELRVIQS